MRRSSRTGALLRAVRCGYVGALIALATGCSSEGKGGNVAGTGGSDAGTGVGGIGGSGGAAGDAGVVPGSDAGGTFSTLDVELQTQACRDYVAAWCDRHLECEIWDESSRDSCMQAVDSCPDRFFLPGSSYTVQSLNACRDEWHTFSCESLARAERPDCIQRGTLAAGLTCRFTTQCASGMCTAFNGECGVCLDPVESGAECQDDVQCGLGHSCRFGRCLQLSAWSGEDSLSDGEPCEYDGKCQGSCAPSQDGPRCVPTPLTGAPCIAELPAAGARRCSRTDYCSEDGLCLTVPGAGAACAPGLRPCQSGNYCDSADGLAPGTCRVWIEPGETCDPAVHNANFACRERTSCQCIDEACSAGMCASTGGFVHSCADGRACPTGSECLEGTCRMLHSPLQCAAE